MTLSACTSCEGFVPASAAACPHCGASARQEPRPGKALLPGLAALALGSGVAITLMACYGLPPCDVDNDKDGYCGLDDCDDSDPLVHRWADDPAGDGKDQNCDGVDGIAPEDAGADGSQACLTCAQGLGTLGTTQSELCEGAAHNAFVDLVFCTCDTTSPCQAVCLENWCASAGMSVDCKTCLDSTCSTQKLTCQEN